MNTISTHHHANPTTIAAAAVAAIAFGTVAVTVSQHSGDSVVPGGNTQQSQVSTHSHPFQYNPGGGQLKPGP